eukprot:14130-Heterococcus_DN1.PRE.2
MSVVCVELVLSAAAAADHSYSHSSRHCCYCCCCCYCHHPATTNTATGLKLATAAITTVLCYYYCCCQSVHSQGQPPCSCAHTQASSGMYATISSHASCATTAPTATPQLAPLSIAHRSVRRCGQHS